MRLCPVMLPGSTWAGVEVSGASHQSLAKLGFSAGRAKDFWNVGFPPFPSQWEALPCLAAQGVLLKAE